MFLKSCFKKTLRKEKGAIIAMTAVMIPIIFGFAGIAFDVGNLYVQKGKLQHIADASALAGAAVYRDIATDKTTSSQIRVDDSFDNTTYFTSRPSNAAFGASNHGEADKSAWDYIDKNKGIRTISVNGPYALNGKVSVSTNEGPAQIDGVYYRVRLSEEVPLHFIPLIPGIANQQEVVAESIVALSTDTGTEPTIETTSNIEYVKIFNNLFNYSGELSDGSSASNSTNTYKASDQVNLRLYNYMVFMNHQYQGVTRDYNSSSISNNNNSSSSLNYYYENYLSYNGRRFVNTQVTRSGDFTVNINNDLDRPYYYLESNNRYYAWNNSRQRYEYNRNNPLSAAGLNQAFPLPYYIFRENDTGRTPVGNTTINVTGNNPDRECYPIVLYQFDKFNNTLTTVTININKGQIFRGIIMASQSNVIINNNGSFEGTVTARNITTTGTGTFTHKNYFQNENGDYAEWYTNYLGLNYDENGNPVYTNAEFSDFVRQIKGDKANIWFYNDKGVKEDPADYYTSQGGQGGWGGWGWPWWDDEQPSQVKNGYYRLDSNGNEVKIDSMENVSFYDSMYYRYYDDGKLKLDLTKYEFGSQEWFEHLNNEQKARLGYYWEYYYDGYGGKKMQWLWARPVTTTFTHTIEGTEALKSLRLINARTETNPFSAT